ncbi:beta-1,4-mannosyl-glycoprotein 4-beta-N-acetylglucosaminyltransferase a [Tachysurus vachellii]|uniref:beta-1,4-mannosyl-glycoprotein 4-beta-N-acetylglucosaminyltransferase a n=1 Tax=Tachysurus vachellii TaxID=175792 RepID=UPI00296AF777|nr:beta-1,4-mannosyl-glycoprotein 4-beta-N-acetylglucosaminyltransferase a [Tachysurus vachellii]
MARLHTNMARMKVRRNLLLCTAGVCLLSLIYCFKILHQEALLQRLYSYSSQLSGFKDFLWEDKLSTSIVYDTAKQKAIRLQTSQRTNPANEDLLLLNSSGLHKQSYILQDEPASYFILTERGALCFTEGTEMGSKTPEDAMVDEPQSVLRKQRVKNESIHEGQPVIMLRQASNCVCHQGWHGPNCGIPTVVQHSNLPTKSHLKPRKVPRRIINAININHEFDMLHARFHELADAVDLFLVCESNYTAYGEAKPLMFLRLLLNGTFDYVKNKIVYIFLDHFPKGGQVDGWIADDYLRTYLTKNGLLRIQGLRPDDVFLIDDADEIPLREGILFLKLYDGWTEPFGIHMRKSLYGFYWRQPGTLDILSGCTIGMLLAVYKGDGILLRRRAYYTMSDFREYEKKSGQVLMPWSIGSPIHYAGWHCSWCFTPKGIYYKLISAQNGDFPRWGDYEEKRKLSYIRELIRTGGWFDGSESNYPPTDPKEHMFAPKYLLDNYKKYIFLLENPYAKG